MNFKLNIQDIMEISPYLNISSKHNYIIETVSSIDKPKSNSLMFIKSDLKNDEIEKLRSVEKCVILVSNKVNISCSGILNKNLIIYVDNAKREWGILLKKIIEKQDEHSSYNSIENGVVLGVNTILGRNVVIEPGVFIDNYVKIGDNCIIKTGSRIRKNVTIGHDTVIYENCVIGSECFGKEPNNEGNDFIHIPHIGGVIIESNVHIHALSYIGSGLIDPTVVGANSHIGASSVVAHNSKLGNDVLLCGKNMVCGGVTIGSNVWIGSGAVIVNKAKIGNKVIVGLGSCVVKNINNNQFVLGVPARSIPNINKNKFNPFNT